MGNYVWGFSDSFHPLSTILDLISLVYAVFQANADHKRMTTIKNILTQPVYREEIVGSGLRQYLKEGELTRNAYRLVTVELILSWSLLCVLLCRHLDQQSTYGRIAD